MEARRSPKPRLYSAEPRSSQFPSTETMKSGCAAKICFKRAGIALKSRLLVLADVVFIVVEINIFHLPASMSAADVVVAGAGAATGGGVLTVTVAVAVVDSPPAFEAVSV